MTFTEQHCRCLYFCSCGWKGSFPARDHAHHDSQGSGFAVEVQDAPEFDAVCVNDCEFNGVGTRCSLSDCVCYASRTGKCAHCDGPARLEPAKAGRRP